MPNHLDDALLHAMDGSELSRVRTEFNDASRCGTDHRAGLRSRHWDAGSVSLRQTDWQLHRAHSVRGPQCPPARLGHISKQGNTSSRFLLGEAAQAASRCNQDWRRRYVHLMMRREKRIAKVAMARKLAVRLYWMWRNITRFARGN